LSPEGVQGERIVAEADKVKFDQAYSKAAALDQIQRLSGVVDHKNGNARGTASAAADQLIPTPPSKAKGGSTQEADGVVVSDLENIEDDDEVRDVEKANP
jgi:hypothetical protein